MPRAQRHITTLLLALAAALAGCASSTNQSDRPTTNNSASTRNAPAITLTPGPHVAIPGSTLLIPIEPPTTSPQPAVGTPLPARLGSQPLPATLAFVGLTPDPAAQSWLPAAGKWFTDPTRATSTSLGQWFAAVDLPADIDPAVAPTSLRIGSSSTDLTWSRPPADLPRELRSAWASPVPQAHRVSPLLLRLADPARASPYQRWRYRLLTGALADASHTTPNATNDRAAPRAGGSFTDPTLETLARQHETRWKLALARLHAADRIADDRLRARLVATASLATETAPTRGAAVPFWPVNQADLDALLEDLLDIRLTAARRVARAESWADAAPATATRITSDADSLSLGSTQSATSSPIPTLTLANADTTPRVATIASDDAPAGPAMHALPIGTILRVPLQPTTNLFAPPTLTLGTDRTDLITQPTLPARPPGVRLAPLIADHDLATHFAARQPATVTTAAALLYLDPDTTAWTLLIEAQTPAPTPTSARTPPPDTFRIFLGPQSRPAAIIRVTPTAPPTNELAPAPETTPSAPTPSAQDAQDPTRWQARVPIPADAITAGMLLIGIERIDPNQRRTAWPRPMTPWQTAPGRVAIDTTAWDTPR